MSTIPAAALSGCATTATGAAATSSFFSSAVLDVITKVALFIQNFHFFIFVGLTLLFAFWIFKSTDENPQSESHSENLNSQQPSARPVIEQISPRPQTSYPSHVNNSLQRRLDQAWIRSLRRSSNGTDIPTSSGRSIDTTPQANGYIEREHADQSSSQTGADAMNNVWHRLFLSRHDLDILIPDPPVIIPLPNLTPAQRPSAGLPFNPMTNPLRESLQRMHGWRQMTSSDVPEHDNRVVVNPRNAVIDFVNDMEESISHLSPQAKAKYNEDKESYMLTGYFHILSLYHFIAYTLKADDKFQKNIPTNIDNIDFSNNSFNDSIPFYLNWIDKEELKATLERVVTQKRPFTFITQLMEIAILDESESPLPDGGGSRYDQSTFHPTPFETTLFKEFKTDIEEFERDCQDQSLEDKLFSQIKKATPEASSSPQAKESSETSLSPIQQLLAEREERFKRQEGAEKTLPEQVAEPDLNTSEQENSERQFQRDIAKLKAKNQRESSAETIPLGFFQKGLQFIQLDPTHQHLKESQPLFYENLCFKDYSGYCMHRTERLLRYFLKISSNERVKSRAQNLVSQLQLSDKRYHHLLQAVSEGDSFDFDMDFYNVDGQFDS